MIEPRLQVIPITISEAKVLIERLHRHHPPPVSGLYAIGAMRTDRAISRAVVTEDAIVGVAIVGRPVARGFQDGFTAEVTRLATDGTRNACSILYGACWRAARALGYRRLVTYTLATEPGSSLRAAGFRDIGRVRARSWHCPSRPRVDRTPLQEKIRWSIEA